ncbi:DUF4156 domain-containing protein [Enterobacter cancerogenus]
MKKLTISLSFMLLTGCSATALNNQAAGVRISNSDPTGCEFLGTVVGEEGGFWTGGWTSNTNLEKGALNTLRNETSRLGGNVVSLLTNRAGVTAWEDHDSGGSTETNVVMTGSAWKCPHP